MEVNNVKVKIISMTENPIDVLASAFAITRGLTYDKYLQAYTDEQKKKNLILNCFESGHMSGFEFVDIDVEAIGFSRVFETQKIRTRHASYEIFSGRHKQDLEFVKPPSVPQEWHDMESIQVNQKYHHLIEQRGVPAEDARYYVGQNLSRKGRIKQNLASWIHTAKYRLCMNAQWEYRLFMELLKEEINKREPFLVQFLQPKCVHDGYCTEQYNRCGAYPTKEEVLNGYKHYQMHHMKSQ